MDAEQFKIFMKHQEKASLQKMVVKQSTTLAAGSSAGPALPLPPPLELAGDVEANFEFFKQNRIRRWDGWLAGHDEEAENEHPCLTVAETDDPEIALTAIKEKVVRKRKFVDWIIFFGLLQDPVESIDDYLRKLKFLLKSCQFGALEKEMLRFKIVTLNKWPNLQTRMLGMQDLKTCRAEKLIVTYGQVVGRTCDDVKKIRKKKECKFCGDWHEFEKGVCPAFDEESDSNESSSGSEASAVIGKIENSPELGGHVTAELDFYV
uniref:Uncharacterized protein n=2 Tax=Culex quinquefasciatus TaxID=7176 RepID=A0A1S4JT39_CULQU